jgi:hypothetical protein
MVRDLYQKFQDATLEFSQTKVPTISKILLLFKIIQQHLEDALGDPTLIKDKSGQKYRGLKHRLTQALIKLIFISKRLLLGITLSSVQVNISFISI